MAECNPQELLDDSACLYGLNPFLLEVAKNSLWCQIAEAVADGGLAAFQEPE